MLARRKGSSCFSYNIVLCCGGGGGGGGGGGYNDKVTKYYKYLWSKIVIFGEEKRKDWYIFLSRFKA